MPAADLETLVEHRICALLRDEAAMLEIAGSATVAMRKSLIEAAADLAHRWPALPAPEKRTVLHALVERVDIGPATIDISTRPAVLPAAVQPEFDIRSLPAFPKRSLLMLSVPASVRRTGMETRLIVQGASGSQASRAPDRSLLRLIAQAHHLHAMVMAGAGKSISELAAEAKLSRSYFTRVFRLSFLAPDVTKAIVQGRQPFEFSAIKLMQAGPLPPDWSQQRHKLGFA